MYPVSGPFRSAIVDSHVMVARVDVHDHDGDYITTLPIIEGNFNMSRQEPFRRQFRFSIIDVDGSFVPETPDDLLSPLSGNIIKAYRGIRLSTGEELVRLGTLDITQAVTDDSGENLRVSVQAVDYSRKVSRAKLTAPYTIAASTVVSTAIQTMISDRVDGLRYEFALPGFTTPVINMNEGADVWEQAMAMAASAGAEIYFDYDGIAILKDIPEPNSMEVAATYVEGESCTVTYINKTLNNDRTFNHVVVIGGSTTTNVVRGEAKDTDRSSPTYWDGPYGDVPNIIRDSLITSTDQANRRARTELLQTLGWTESISMAAVPNPALEVGDLIFLQRAKSKLSGYFTIEKHDIPMGPVGAHQLTVKRVHRG